MKVTDIVKDFLGFIETRRKASTVAMHNRYLKPLIADLGDRRVDELTHAVMYQWLEGGRRAKWEGSTIRAAGLSVIAAFNWAVRSHTIPANPVKGIELPPSRSRGVVSLIGDTIEERNKNHARILDASSRSFRPFVVCLWATGARPGELAAATARDFDQASGAIVFHTQAAKRKGMWSHKTASKGKARRIYLHGEALEIVQAMAARWPSGKLFRTKCGGPWVNKEIYRSFAAIRRRTRLPNVTAYSYRHTFATSWLDLGKPIEVLAQLMGNTPQTIRGHYAHLCANIPNLRSQLEDFHDSLKLT